MAQKYQIDPAKLCEILRNTVVKDTKAHTVTNEELAAFVIVANQYNLNPFTRQIHAFVSEKSGSLVPIVGIDGWAAVVNAHEDFDGCEFEELSDENGSPLCTTCCMYVKGRSHPVRVTEWFSECRRPTAPWTTMPRRMLRHKAYMQAARICFGLSGIYDEDEAQDIVQNERQTHMPPIGRISVRQPRQANPAQPRQQPPEAYQGRGGATITADERTEDAGEVTMGQSVIDPDRQPGSDEDPEPSPPVEQMQDSNDYLDLVAGITERIMSTRDVAILRAEKDYISSHKQILGDIQCARLIKSVEDRIRQVERRK